MALYRGFPVLRQYGIPVHRLSWALYRGQAVAFAFDSVRHSSQPLFYLTTKVCSVTSLVTPLSDEVMTVYLARCACQSSCKVYVCRSAIVAWIIMQLHILVNSQTWQRGLSPGFVTFCCRR